MRRQQGASLAMVILAIAIIAAVLLTLRSIGRTQDRAQDREATLERLARAQAALEEYAAIYHRLPCPAEPTSNTGKAGLSPLGTFCINLTGLGTLPWAELGMRAEDAVDAWGLKISYAVYNGTAGIGIGSVVRPEGLNMVDCDLNKAGLPDLLTGLCRADHTTGKDKFLANKGLRVEDHGVDRDDVAYVLISHGPTGGGGFAVNGVQRAITGSNDEKKNAQVGTQFYAKGFSGSDVEFNDNKHFDDYVVYRSLADLVTRIGLTARVWPIPGQAALATFNQQTLNAAGPGSLGVQTLVVNGVTAGTLTSGATLGMGEVTLNDGSTAQGIGVSVGGGEPILSATAGGVANAVFGLQFETPVRFVGVALADFGTNGLLAERVRFDFYNASGGTFTPVGSAITKSGCRPDGGYATFSVQASVDFNAVALTPLAARDLFGNTGPTSFLLSQVIACDGSASSCPVPMADPLTNACP